MENLPSNQEVNPNNYSEIPTALGTYSNQYNHSEIIQLTFFAGNDWP